MLHWDYELCDMLKIIIKRVSMLSFFAFPIERNNVHEETPVLRSFYDKRYPPQAWSIQFCEEWPFQSLENLWPSEHA